MSKTLPINKVDTSFMDAAKHYCPKPYTLFFDSNRLSHPENKWSFLCFNPVEKITSKNGIIQSNLEQIKRTDLFEFLKEKLYSYDFNQNSHIPFIGGIAGYWGYDLGRQLEDLPNQTQDDLNLPDMAIGIYTTLYAYDHQNKECWFIGDKEPEFKVDKEIDLNIYQTNIIDQKSETDYEEDIAKAIEYICAGEIYQANLSRRFDFDLPKSFCSFTHYLQMRDINPAPFSSFMNFDDFQLGSCSPERFLKLTGNKVETKPIKGTITTSKDKDTLETSLKDRAENLMIVDLLRNDLSKVCKPHSVEVPTLCNIETFEGLHHMVSTVRGVLKNEENALSLLKSCFPGGSITGAPKIRAMEIIEELEETRRGPYCGAMGYIGFNGDMDTNIIIRTVIYKKDKAYIQTGSGIVSDSMPKNEVQEGLDKAQKIFESFEDQKNKDAA